MKIVFRLPLVLLSLSLINGCAVVGVDMAGYVDKTPDDLRRSKYRAEFFSGKFSKEITSCMLEAVKAYREGGHAHFAHKYSIIATRDLGQMQEITNHNPGVTGNEIMFLVENSTIPTGGTKSQIWSTPNIPFGMGSQGYLDRLISAVKPCIGDVNAIAAGSPTSVQTMTPGYKAAPISSVESRSKDGPVDKLEQLKGLLDRGVISKDDFEMKKKEILDKF
jgi:hypothetical protein